MPAPALAPTPPPLPTPETAEEGTKQLGIAAPVGPTALDKAILLAAERPGSEPTAEASPPLPPAEAPLHPALELVGSPSAEPKISVPPAVREKSEPVTEIAGRPTLIQTAPSARDMPLPHPDDKVPPAAHQPNALAPSHLSKKERNVQPMRGVNDEESGERQSSPAQESPAASQAGDIPASISKGVLSLKAQTIS